MDWGRSQEPKWRKGLREGLREDCLKGSDGRKPPLLVVGCQIDAKVEGQGLTFEEVCLFLFSNSSLMIDDDSYRERN